MASDMTKGKKWFSESRWEFVNWNVVTGLERSAVLRAVPPHPLSFSLREKETAIDVTVTVKISRLLTAPSASWSLNAVTKTGPMDFLSPRERIRGEGDGRIVSLPELVKDFPITMD